MKKGCKINVRIVNIRLIITKIFFIKIEKRDVKVTIDEVSNVFLEECSAEEPGVEAGYPRGQVLCTHQSHNAELLFLILSWVGPDSDFSYPSDNG